MKTESLTITTPDDWHVHFRDNDDLRAIAPWTARHFARAIVMPNLKPPVVTCQEAAAYRERIQAACGRDFEPLMTVYLTDQMDLTDLKSGLKSKLITAAKYYPANATTNSESGIRSLATLERACAVLEECGRPLLVHGESTDAQVDVFDREKVFIDQTLAPLAEKFPGLRIVFEHVTTQDAIAFVRSKPQQMAATITAHHLIINRNAMFQGGIRPHYYCLPVAKRETHRLALVEAATSGDKQFFLGTDSAPHAIDKKENDCGCAGIFSAPTALACYAEVFYQSDALENLEAFASKNGPKFYNLPENKSRTRLTRRPQSVPELIDLDKNGRKVRVFNESLCQKWTIERL